jgi:CRP-like cAMP-binding protein
MADKTVLTEFGFFSDIEPASLEEIAKVIEVRECSANEVLFLHDEKASHFFGLLGGEVELSLVFVDKVLRTDIEYEESIHASMEDQEKSIVVATVQPGQVFGWSALIGSPRRNVTAKCTRDSRVIALSAAELQALFEKNHTLGYKLMKKLADIIAKRLQDRTDKLIEAWVEAFDVDKL